MKLTYKLLRTLALGFVFTSLAACGKQEPADPVWPEPDPQEEEEEIPVFCIENKLVTKYLSEVSYPSDDYSFSRIESYYSLDIFDSPRPDQPVGVPVSWTANPSAAAHKVSVADNKDLSGAWTYDLTDRSTCTYTVYNLIPGRHYWYKVEASLGNGSVVTEKEGEFKTSGKVRMAKIDGVVNVRDIGGWTSTAFMRKDGSPRTIRYGKVYRGGELNATGAITADGKVEMVKHLGVRYELDFRKDSEQGGKPGTNPIGPEVKYVNCSNSSYANIKSNSSIKANAHYMYDAMKAGKGLYFHCVAGADRTGTMAFLLEGLLGVSESDLCKEYELTSFSKDAKGNFRVRSRTNDYHKYADMVKALKDNFKGTTIQEKCNSWYLANGFTQEDIDWIIDYLLE